MSTDRYTSLYTELAKNVREAGLLRRCHLYYWTEIAVAVASFGGIWVAFALLGDSWFQLVLAGALGIVVTQFGFLGHDASHRQMFDSATWNAWTARILAGAFAGLSFHWWRAKHNLHHKSPNKAGYDPDIAPGAISFTPDIVEARAGFSGWLVHRQGWFFFPLLTLEGLNLHVSSLRSTLDRTSIQPWRRLELLLVTTRLVAYVAVLLVFLPFGMAVAFFAIQMAVFGLCLGASFAPAHKGMPIVPAEMNLDFLRRQVMVSRNVYGNPLVDFFMGGLNYQIEHHLFPSMPRPNLPVAQALIRQHCRDRGIPYTEASLLGSYALGLRHMHRVGTPLRGS